MTASERIRAAREAKAAEQTYTDTGRTAIFADGHSERIYETFHMSGIFAGTTYEVTESELPLRLRQS